MLSKLAALKQRLAKLTKKQLVLLSVGLLCLVIILVLVFLKPHAAVPSNSIPPVLVEVVKVKQQTIPVSINAFGTLVADNQVDISPEIDGQIAKIGFNNGQYVKRGQLLFQLDDSIVRTQLSAAQAKLKLSLEDLRRSHRLLTQDALSQQAVDTATAAVAEDESTTNEKQIRVDKMQLRAPFNGILGSRSVSIGQYVTVGETLVTLVNTDSLKVIYNVSQTYLSQLKLGQTVEITSSALPGESFSGTVSYISPSIDTTSRTVEVHATVPNNAGQLAPGMFVTINQELSERPNSLVIPAEALVATIAGNEVYVLQDDRVIETPVQVGARWDNMVEITSGLNLNQQVVSVGQQRLRDGSIVKVITPKVLK